MVFFSYNDSRHNVQSFAFTKISLSSTYFILFCLLYIKRSCLCVFQRFYSEFVIKGYIWNNIINVYIFGTFVCRAYIKIVWCLVMSTGFILIQTNSKSQFDYSFNGIFFCFHLYYRYVFFYSIKSFFCVIVFVILNLLIIWIKR